MGTKGQAPRPIDEEKLRKACTDFESIFLNQILRAMRQTVPHGGFLKEGPEKDIFQSLFDQELSRSLAQRKGMGLGEMIFRQMKRRGRAHTDGSGRVFPGNPGKYITDHRSGEEVMAQQHDSLDALWRWMGEDMTSHQALLEEMRQEWGCLKKNDLPSLLPLLQVKETHMRRIKAHRESMAQIINGLLGEGVGKDRPRVLSDLLPLVSPSQAQRIKSYQRGIERLLHQIVSLNEQNKRFIQETLTYLDGSTLDYIESLFSLFTSSHQEEIPMPEGGRPYPPLFLRAG